MMMIMMMTMTKMLNSVVIMTAWWLSFEYVTLLNDNVNHMDLLYCLWPFYDVDGTKREANIHLKKVVPGL